MKTKETSKRLRQKNQVNNGDDECKENHKERCEQKKFNNNNEKKN